MPSLVRVSFREPLSVSSGSTGGSGRLLTKANVTPPITAIIATQARMLNVIGLPLWLMPELMKGAPPALANAPEKTFLSAAL
jgi:hypothetical protein